MTAKYEEAQKAVQEKMDQVKEIKDKLEKLEEEQQFTLNFIQKLKNDKILCENRLENAK